MGTILKSLIRASGLLLLWLLMFIPTSPAYAVPLSEFFPAQGGYTWEYLLTNGSTRTVKAIANSNGTTSFHHYNGPNYHVNVFFINSSGLFLWKATRGGCHDLITFTPVAQVSYADVNVGDNITTNGTSNIILYCLDNMVNVNYTANAVIQGLENVTTPAGTFPAYKLRLSINMYGNVRGQTINETETTYYWVAQGIGIIKTLEYYNGIFQTWSLLTDSNLLDDADSDGVPDILDNCKYASNPDQANFDGDVLGDACDYNDDNDPRNDTSDAFPFDPTEWLDTDEDGVGDNGDNCPAIANTNQADFDGDGQGDVCDADDDNDGVDDGSDLFPNNASESADTDADGMGDNYETANGLNPAVDDAGDDKDADGLTNLEEFQLDTRADNPDTDGDGINDKAEVDAGRNPKTNEGAVINVINTILMD